MRADVLPRDACPDCGYLTCAAAGLPWPDAHFVCSWPDDRDGNLLGAQVSEPVDCAGPGDAAGPAAEDLIQQLLLLREGRLPCGHTRSNLLSLPSIVTHCRACHRAGYRNQDVLYVR